MRKKTTRTGNYVKRFSDESETKIVRDYQGGCTTTELARQWKCALQTICNVLFRRGVEMRQGRPPLTLTPETQAAIVAAAVAGKFPDDIARDAKVKLGTLRNWLQRGRAGHPSFTILAKAVEEARKNSTPAMRVIQMASRIGICQAGRVGSLPIHHCNESYFSVIDTPEKAYWLGMLAADGCVTRLQGVLKRVCLALKIGDREHVEAFRRAVSADAPVHVMGPRTDYSESFGWVTGTGRAWLFLRSEQMASDLGRLGIVERKSFTVHPWEGPVGFLRHWWRGCFDGDGGFSKLRKRASGGYQWQAGFTGNAAMAEGFAQFIRQHTGSSARICPHGSVFRASFGGLLLCKKIAALLYDGATVSLERKRLLAQDILET